MKTNSLRHHLITGLCAIALVAPGVGRRRPASPRNSSRKSIGLGEAAQLAVTVKGSQSAEPNVPHVDGLEIVPVGQQSSVQMINGAVSANVTHIYQVTPNRAGSFTIPAITAAGAGSTQPIAFRVDKGAGGQTQRAPSQGRSQLPAPSISRRRRHARRCEEPVRIPPRGAAEAGTDRRRTRARGSESLLPRRRLRVAQRPARC